MTDTARSLVIDITDEKDDLVLLLPCPICGAKFFSPTGVEVHVNVVHPGPFDRNDVEILETKSRVRHPGLVGGSRKPLKEYSVHPSPSSSSASGDLLRAQLSARNREQNRRFHRGNKDANTSQDVIDLDVDSPVVLSSSRNGGTLLETDYEVAQRLQKELDAEHHQPEIITLPEDPVSRSNSAVCTDSMDDPSRLVDEEPNLTLSPLSSKSDSPGTPSPLRALKSPELLPLSNVDDGFDLTSPATQRQILSHPNSDQGNAMTFDVLDHIAENEKEDAKVLQVGLCVNCVHFSADFEDVSFSCGYRNIQTVISAMYNFPALRQNLVERLGGLYVPGIPKLQGLLESAWTNGWDSAGRKEHKSKLVRSLAVVDVFALFMNIGIECKTATFVHSHSGKGSHPALFDWIDRHFAESSRTPVLPIYLQYEEHSVTVVGFERRDDPWERQLLVFDPAIAKKQIERKSGNQIVWLRDSVRRSLKSLHQPSYQVLLFTGRVIDAEDQQRVRIASKDGVTGERFVS